MELLLRITTQLRENKKALELVFDNADLNSLFTRAERLQLESVDIDNDKLIADLDKLISVLRTMK